MRRSVVRRLAVLLLVLSTVAPVSAVPRQDDGLLIPSRFVERFIERIKRVIIPLEDIRVTIPTP